MKFVTIRALWDPEAPVWVADSDEVPGLITEAPDEQTLVDKLKVMVPELLELNHVKPQPSEIHVEFYRKEHEKRITIPRAA
jgi:hypothetical protein